MAVKQEGRVLIQEPSGTWVESILPETPAMATFLEGGYGMSLEKAQTILKERPEHPELWPYDVYEKALAFKEAYEAHPKPGPGRKAWRLTPHVPQPRDKPKQ